MHHGLQEGVTSANWFDNVMINHEMSLKVTMFFETFLVMTFGDIWMTASKA